MRRKFTVLFVLAITAGCIWLWIDSFLWSKNLTLESSERIATQVMEKACARRCAEKGIKQADLDGPQPSPINFKSGSRKFEYTWTYPRGALLVVVFDDAGWLPGGVEYWWLD
jgi:hypothetical protein